MGNFFCKVVWFEKCNSKMKLTGWLKLYKGLCTLLAGGMGFSMAKMCFCTIALLLVFFHSNVLIASDKAVHYNQKKFNLKAENNSFDEVLDNLAKVTGYSVELQSGLDIKDKKFTFQLKDVSLMEGIKRIVRGYSNFLEIDDQKRNILIRIAPEKKIIERDFYSSLDKSFREKDMLVKKNNVAEGDYEVVPPGEGEVRGITRSELENLIKEQKRNTDPLSIEVVPPDVPGEKSITRREVNALQRAQPKLDPLDVELVPPGNSGEKGITRRELNAILENKQVVDPLDYEVVPPDNPGEKGITRRELNRILELQKK